MTQSAPGLKPQPTLAETRHSGKGRQPRSTSERRPGPAGEAARFAYEGAEALQPRGPGCRPSSAASQLRDMGRVALCPVLPAVMEILISERCTQSR